MSRIGKKPITIPAGVDVKVDGSKVTVKGPKGTLENTFNSEINIALEGNEIIVTRPTDDKNHRALHGLTRTLIHNMVEGVTNGYSKTLEVNGVGYRAQKQGKNLVLNLGYSHQVIVPEVPGITIEVPSANSVVISGADKQQVGQFAAEVRERREDRSRIRARVSSTPTSISAAKRVKPARVLRNNKGVYKRWLQDQTPIRQDLSVTPASVLRSAVRRLVRALMYSAPTATSTPSLSTT